MLPLPLETRRLKGTDEIDSSERDDFEANFDLSDENSHLNRPEPMTTTLQLPMPAETRGLNGTD